jgi:cbb3-type cytochrome oxidase subunit 3
MMKDVIRALETGALAEVALIAFFLAFTLVLIYTFTLPRRARDEAKQLPFHDALPAEGRTSPASPDA